MLTLAQIVELLCPNILVILWRASWQGAIAVVAIAAICRALPRLPASVRCWLWKAVLLKFVLTLFLPVGVHVPVMVRGDIPAAMVIAEERRQISASPSNKFEAKQPEVHLRGLPLQTPPILSGRQATLPPAAERAEPIPPEVTATEANAAKSPLLLPPAARRLFGGCRGVCRATGRTCAADAALPPRDVCADYRFRDGRR